MARRSATLIGLTLLLVLTGVVLVTTRQSGPSAVSPTELYTHLELWKSLDRGTYEYTMQRFCECDSRPIRVRVVDGKVVSTTVVAMSVPIPPGPSGAQLVKGAALTMPQQFDRLEESYRQKYHKVTVEYDPVIGFPARFYQDRSADMIDDEVETRIFDVVLNHGG